MPRSSSLMLTPMLLVAMAGCAKSSANSAVAKAEKDIAALPPDAAKVAPKEVKAMNESIAALKTDIANGNFRDALMGGRGVSSQARDLALNLNARRTQITAAFNSTAEELPKRLATLQAKVDELGKARRLRPDVDATKFAALKAALPSWTQAWADASQAFKNGDIAVALSRANEVKAHVAEAMRVVGLE